MRPNNSRGKAIQTPLKIVRVDLCYLSYVPPTHKCGTRPFLRWVRSQGRSPHASGKAQNTFDPVDIPLLRAPGNNTPPKGVKACGDCLLRLEVLSSAEAHPAEPPRGTTAYRMQPNNWRGKVTQTPLKSVRVDLCLFVAAFHQTRLDTRSKARRPIKVGIKGRGRSGTSRDSNPAGLCCSSAHLLQCEPDEASSFTNPNVGPGTYVGLWLELDSKV